MSNIVEHVQVDQDGLIHAFGYFPEGSGDPSLTTVVIAEEEVWKLTTPAKRRVLLADGTIELEPPDPPEPAPPTKQEILLMMLEGVEPQDADTELLWLVLQESLRP